MVILAFFQSFQCLKISKKLNLMTTKTSQIAKNDLTIDKHIIYIRKAAEELKSNISFPNPWYDKLSNNSYDISYSTIRILKNVRALIKLQKFLLMAVIYSNFKQSKKQQFISENIEKLLILLQKQIDNVLIWLYSNCIYSTCSIFLFHKLKAKFLLNLK